MKIKIEHFLGKRVDKLLADSTNLDGKSLKIVSVIKDPGEITTYYQVISGNNFGREGEIKYSGVQLGVAIEIYNSL